jgi:hypothetical protein
MALTTVGLCAVGLYFFRMFSGASPRILLAGAFMMTLGIFWLREELTAKSDTARQ